MHKSEGKKMLRTVMVAAAAVVLCAGSTVTLGRTAPGIAGATAGPEVATDFDGDGYADLAVGSPFETIAGQKAAGAVNVIYGGSGGLAAAGNQLWHQGSPGIANRAERGDRFGMSVSAGDFDGDGYSDLAVAAPQESINGIGHAGSVNVIYGSATGLTAAGNQFWHQDKSGILDQAESADRFGWALSTGDFDGDGYADLAVGSPYEDVNGRRDAGAVI